jgi:hypothetical protein
MGGFNIKREMKRDLRKMEEIRPNRRRNTETLISLQPLNGILRSRGPSCSPFESTENERGTMEARGKLSENESKRMWGVLGEEEDGGVS